MVEYERYWGRIKGAKVKRAEWIKQRPKVKIRRWEKR